jgi:hypothetical protein
MQQVSGEITMGSTVDIQTTNDANFNVNLLGYTTRKPHNAQRCHQSEDRIHVQRHNVHHRGARGNIVQICLGRHCALSFTLRLWYLPQRSL